MSYEGGCSCRSVRYRMKREPLIVHACHCLDCQRITGSAFVMNALIEKSNFELLSGEPTSFDMRKCTGMQHTAYFCGDCGTYVWSEYSRRAKPLWLVRVGTLDDPNTFPPDVHIFTKRKQPWVQIAEGLPTYNELYAEREGLWSEESLQRLDALKRAG